VFVNSGEISQGVVDNYQVKEGKKPVKLKPEHDFSWKRYQIIAQDFIDEADIVRHHPAKLAQAIIEVAER
jgi:hypothetical protein